MNKFRKASAPAPSPLQSSGPADESPDAFHRVAVVYLLLGGAASKARWRDAADYDVLLWSLE